MKVITQLIRHFWQRGALSSSEIEYLLRHGFVRLRDLPGYKPAKQAAVIEPDQPRELLIEPPGALEVLEEALVRRSTRRRLPGQPRGDVLEIDDLVERLEGEFARRAGDLASLIELGSHFEPCDTWQDAAVVLRQQSPEAICTGLVTTLASHRVKLGDLWQSVELEPFHEIISDDEVRGPAVRAFLALLVADASSKLGRHGWVLKHEAMCAVGNLRRVHFRVLNGLHELFHRDPDLLTKAMRQDCDTTQFWAFVLLYNAHRESTPNDLPDYGREYELPLPRERVWQQAWTSALFMNRVTLLELLVACYLDPQSQQTRASDECQRKMICPVGWHCPD